MRRSIRSVRPFHCVLAVLWLVWAVPAAAGQKPPKAVTDWLKSNAIPLTTVEAGHGLDDMIPLATVVGDAHAVALGEGTHGTSEFQKFKHRMLEFLVEEKGFTAFAMETGFGDAFAVNDFVLNGTGNPAQAIKAMGYWPWSTQELLDMVLWMRAYNQDPAHAAKVQFFGFDMQDSGPSTTAALGYLESVDPAYAATASADLQKFTTDSWEWDYASQSSSVIQADATTIAGVLSDFDQNRASYSALSGEKAWALARQHVRAVQQCQALFRIPMDDFWDSMNCRDAAMAENALWLLAYEGPDTHFVLWAHNGHVSFDQGDYGWYTMGTHLKENLGADLVVMGLEFDQGQFLAVKETASGYGDLTVFTVKPAIKSSINAALASAKIPIFAVDIRNIPPSDKNGAWWHAHHPERSIGAVYDPDLAQQYYLSLTPPDAYDVYLFIESTNATTLLP